MPLPLNKWDHLGLYPMLLHSKALHRKETVGDRLLENAPYLKSILRQLEKEGGGGGTRNVKELKQMIMVVNRATSNFECTSQIQTKISIYASSI